MPWLFLATVILVFLNLMIIIVLRTTRSRAGMIFMMSSESTV